MFQALLIDDDAKLAELLKEYLGRFGIELLAVQEPEAGLRLLRKMNPLPAIVILDVMLPGKDGFEVCREIRRESDIPIVMLTARGDTTDRIVGLELGADDYLPKPFEPRELVARLTSVVRRASQPHKSSENKNSAAEGVLRFGSLEIRTVEREAFLDGVALVLTSTEYELLLLLASNAGRKLDRDEIMNHLRGIDSDVFSRSIDILVSRLRAKLGDDPKSPRFIKTAWGTGYVFVGKAAR